jgi:hypothetical protein
LVACGSTPQVAEEPQLSTDEFIEELQTVTKPGYSYCAFLRIELAGRSDIPEMLQCNDDENPMTGENGIVVAFADQTQFFIENDIDITYDIAFAPVDAMANAFDQMGADQFTSVDLFLVFFDDQCNNTWEVRPTTLAKLGAREVTLDEAMDEVDLYGDANCP